MKHALATRLYEEEFILLYDMHQSYAEVEAMLVSERRLLLQLWQRRKEQEKAAAEGRSLGDSLLRRPVGAEAYGQTDVEQMSPIAARLQARAARRRQPPGGTHGG